MEPIAILAVQLAHLDARSALPDAPVVDDRPSRLRRMAAATTATARRLRLAVPTGPRRAEVRRAA